MRELKRLQTFGRLASNSPQEGQVYVDAPHAWREVASGTATAADAGGLQWLEEPSGPMTTLQRLGRTRRVAPSARLGAPRVSWSSAARRRPARPWAVGGLSAHEGGRSGAGGRWRDPLR